jgi:hypothetical protein
MKGVARELRNSGGEIMRWLDQGESFVVSRNGIPVGELSRCAGIGLSAPRRPSPRSEALRAWSLTGSGRTSIRPPAGRSRLMPEAPHPSRGLVDASVATNSPSVPLPSPSSQPAHTPRAMPASEHDVKIAYSEPRPPSTRYHSMPARPDRTDASTRRSSRPATRHAARGPSIC